MRENAARITIPLVVAGRRVGALGYSLAAPSPCLFADPSAAA